jgi:hypothetical protein
MILSVIRQLDTTIGGLIFLINSYFNCTEFYEHLLHKPDLLKQIRSSEKYSHITKVPRKVK